MVNLTLLGLNILLLSEYGFQTRKRAMAMWMRGWVWKRTLLRMLACGVFYFELESGSIWARLAFCASWFVLSEIGALVFRILFRRRHRVGVQHGGIATHLFPIAFAGCFPLVSWLLACGLGSSQHLLHLSAALVPIAVLSAMLLLWTWGTFFTVCIIDLARPEQITEQVTPRVGAGELIGILERLLTFLLVASGGWTAVGFVIAAKAAARFPLFEQKEFAEYFLLGSMSSVGLSILTGVLVKAAI